MSNNLWRVQYETPIGWAMYCFVEFDKKDELLKRIVENCPDLKFRVIEETEISRDKILEGPYKY